VIGAAVRDGVRVGITGVGAAAPERVLTNDQLAAFVETSHDWIVERTGIHERRVSEPGVAASDLSIPAARQALEAAGVQAAELDLVIVATITPDYPFPATASVVADAIGAEGCAAYDLQAGCTGFVYAITQAYGQIASGLARKVLVVSGGFLAFELGNDGSGVEHLWVPAGGTRALPTHRTVDEKLQTMRMNGREVYRFATRVMVSSARSVLETAGMTPSDVDLYVPHQANKRIIDHAARELGIPSEKVFINVNRYGNTSSASIPLCLDEAVREGALRKGTRLLMTGVGTGLTWGSALIEWSATNGSRTVA
jgi:3-oxoacyl-[acyl-carrier-protein] synthase-3